MASHEFQSGPRIALPVMRDLQSALRTTTELLAHEVARPSRQTPRWSELEWRLAEATAVMHGTSALLANHLRWQGSLRWQTFLATQKHHTQWRQARIDELLQRLDRLARQAGVPVAALKGAALHRRGFYPLGDRPMSDIDLLTADADCAAVVDLVTSLGYREGPLTPRHRVFEPADSKSPRSFGEHVDHPIKIELHLQVAEALPVRQIDITASILPPGSAPGLHFYPSQVVLMRHLLLHAAGNLRSRTLRFVQLHDIARVAAQMTAADWQELSQDHDTGHAPWWCLAPLALTMRYHGAAVPDRTIDALIEQCPRLLRRAVRRQKLTDVSWSRLYIQAFPGLEWCHSASEALRFMASRVFPSATMRDELREIAVRQPYSVGTAWYGLSHGARMLRWLFSSPPRVQAIYPIRIALGLQPP